MEGGLAPSLLLQLLAIFVCAKLFGEVFERIKLPAVVGEILAGVVLGPYALGVVQPSDTIISIAEIGAIFLLFTTGLETSPKELLQVGRQSLGVATGGVAVPFLLGTAYLFLLKQPAHEALFVAAAMVATSVGITARVLGDMHVLQTRDARIILGAAVFDDILGMIILALVIGLASATGVNWMQLSITFVEAVGFAVVMILYAPRIVRRMRPGLQRLSSHEAPLILALAICLMLSYLAEKIGMAAIIGAFFAGLAFAELAPEWGLKVRVGAINQFLTPYFFFVMGARLNLEVFNGKLIASAIVLSLLAVVSKMVGCGAPVLRLGWKTALRVGVGMVPRGEVGLIVALVGLQMRTITDSAYALIVFMTAATTLLAPPVLQVLFRQERRAMEAPAAEPVA